MVEPEKPVPFPMDQRNSEPDRQPLPVVRPLPPASGWRQAQASLPKTTSVTPLLASQRLPGQRMPGQHLSGQRLPELGHDTGPDTGAETPDTPPPITTPPGSLPPGPLQPGSTQVHARGSEGLPPGLKPLQPPKTPRTPLGDTLTLLTMPGRGKPAPVRSEGRGRSASAPPGLSSQGPRPLTLAGPSGTRPPSGSMPSGSDLLPVVKPPPTPRPTPPAGRKLMVESTLQELTRVIRREQQQEQEDAHDRTF